MGQPGSEQLYVPEPGKVAVKNTDGTVDLIPQGYLPEARREGSAPATEAEYFSAKHGAAGDVAAGVTGAARGATFGLSDPLLLGAAEAFGGNKEEYRNTLRLLRQTSPNASLGGEIAGAVAPAVASGGLTLGTGGGARLAAGAIEGAGIGAASGAGGLLTEDTLENHKSTAEAYLSQTVKGGAIGLLLGVAGAGVGLLGRRGGAAVARAEEGAAVRAVEREAEGVAERAGGRVAIDADAGLASKAGAVEKPFVLGKASRPVSLDEAVLGDVGPMPSAKGVRSYRSFADSTIALDAEAGLAGKAGNFEKPFSFGKGREVGIRGAALEGELAPIGAQAPIAVDREILTWPGIRPDAGLEKVPTRIKSALHVESPVGLPRPVGLAEGVEGGIVSRPGLSIEAPPVVPAAAPRTTVAESLGELRDYLARPAPAEVSLDNVVRGAKAIATGNPLTMASFAARTSYGRQAVAYGLDMALQVDTFRRATVKLDAMIDAGAKAFASGSKTATRAAKPVTTAEVRAIREAARSPEAVTARVAEHLGDMPNVTPKVAQEIATATGRAAAWLQHALPKEAPPIAPKFGKAPEIPLSNEQLLDARATIETVGDGSVVVDRLRDGTLRDAHVAALRFVHPETFLKIQKYLTQHATELNKTMTQQQLTRLGILFGEPLTEQDLPENVRAFQASFVQGNQAPGAGGDGGIVKMNSKPVVGGGSSATQNDRLGAVK